PSAAAAASAPPAPGAPLSAVSSAESGAARPDETVRRPTRAARPAHAMCRSRRLCRHCPLHRRRRAPPAAATPAPAPAAARAVAPAAASPLPPRAAERPTLGGVPRDASCPAAGGALAGFHPQPTAHNPALAAAEPLSQHTASLRNAY